MASGWTHTHTHTHTHKHWVQPFHRGLIKSVCKYVKLDILCLSVSFARKVSAIALRLALLKDNNLGGVSGRLSHNIQLLGADNSKLHVVIHCSTRCVKEKFMEN